MALTATIEAYNERRNLIERDLRILCKLAGLTYLSPHKLRHGHVVHALKQARNMAEFKAISQNVMHASTIITDQVYGKLIANDVQNIIGNLGKKRSIDLGDQIGELLALLKQASL
jgi:integrase